MFQHARQSRVFQDIINQIQEAILQGKLKAGDKLPAERKLKELFNTSRGTLREALRVLEQKGLITIKTGTSGGAIVKNVTTHNISESLDLLIRSQKISLNDLAQFRRDIEGIVTGMAAKHITKEGVELLKKIIDEVKDYLDEGVSNWDKFINADNNFHMELAKIAGNPLYESVLGTVHDNIYRYYNRFLEKDAALINHNYKDMCDILEAVTNRDSARAKSLARYHVKRFNKLMEKVDVSQLAEKISINIEKDIISYSSE
jgi:DNA-binding FadR family transcriptional regulator